MKTIKVTTEQLTSLFDHTSFDTNLVISELEPNHEWTIKSDCTMDICGVTWDGISWDEIIYFIENDVI